MVIEMIKGLTFVNQSFIINMLIVSATRIRPVVANDYRKWLILIFYSFLLFFHNVPLNGQAYSTLYCVVEIIVWVFSWGVLNT
jgi:hypothetical protein